MGRLDVLFAQFGIDQLDERAHLAIVDGRGDHEVIGEGGHLPDVQEQHVLRLAVSQQVDDSAGEVGGCVQ